MNADEEAEAEDCYSSSKVMSEASSSKKQLGFQQAFLHQVNLATVDEASLLGDVSDLDLLGPDGKLLKVPKLPVMQKSNKNTVILNLATKSSYK